ncbi:MAG: hypothetical protein PHQ43_00050 [Dehalococcoidales bacterium]|nr:hypothetical protein [Dehalococcoidales bacterium]
MKVKDAIARLSRANAIPETELVDFYLNEFQERLKSKKLWKVREVSQLSREVSAWFTVACLRAGISQGKIDVCRIAAEELNKSILRDAIKKALGRE